MKITFEYSEVKNLISDDYFQELLNDLVESIKVNNTLINIEVHIADLPQQFRANQDDLIMESYIESSEDCQGPTLGFWFNKEFFDAHQLVYPTELI